MSNRPIYQIASEIAKDWKATSKNGIYFGAVPYLEAMHSLNSPTDKYGYDDAKTMILYFLSNASTYRGPKAKELKAELKQLVGLK
jgi:hypothetical protein